MLLSRKVLQRILGVLWLVNGLPQVQPHMFTMNMVNGAMKLMLQGQPGALEPSLQFIVAQTTLHFTAANLLIVIVQVLLGLGFLFVPSHWITPVALVSFIWALIVWYRGEGLSMLQTDQHFYRHSSPLGLRYIYDEKPDDAHFSLNVQKQECSIRCSACLSGLGNRLVEMDQPGRRG